MAVRVALVSPNPQSPTYGNYVRALEGAGAMVVPVEGGGALPDDARAVCFTGGPDLDPAGWGEALHPAARLVPADREAVLRTAIADARSRRALRS
jgi:hypothetical protein